MIQVRRREPESGGGGSARFPPGSIVAHRRYGYRGVVVAADERCMADEAWYRSNQTQPDRDQPWYHTLVDGVLHVTYAAQENLMPDPTGAPVHHPLLERYFTSYADGSYVRNDLPWQG